MSCHFTLGIQYNWRAGETYPLITKLQKAAGSRIEVEADHVLINLLDDEAPRGQHSKLLDHILPEALPISDYSNIYLRLPATAVVGLRAKNRLNISSVKDVNDFLANFSTADADLLAAIRADLRYPFYNDLFQMMGKVAAATGMLHTLEFAFEDKEEWGTSEDMVFVSCMLED